MTHLNYVTIHIAWLDQLHLIFSGPFTSKMRCSHSYLIKFHLFIFKSFHILPTFSSLLMSTRCLTYNILIWLIFFRVSLLLWLHIVQLTCLTVLYLVIFFYFQCTFDRLKLEYINNREEIIRITKNIIHVETKSRSHTKKSCCS